MSITVAELIEKLKTFPPEAEVWTNEGSGCNECNPNGVDYYNEIYCIEYADRYVNGYSKDAKKVVVL